MLVNGARGGRFILKARRRSRSFARFGIGEGREIRPQLRCGIVPQTPTTSANGVGKAKFRVGNGAGVKARSEDGRAQGAHFKFEISNLRSARGAP